MNTLKRRQKTKNPATPDQQSRIDKFATIMATSAASFSTE